MINVNMTGKAGVTLATAGKYCADNVKVTPSAEILRKDEQAKSATPTETAQDITPDSGKVLSKVSVGAIPKTYVGSGVTKKAAATVSPSTSEQTVCASGVYTTGAQKVSAITPSIVGNLDASSFASSIVAAIEGKGVTVPDGTLLDGMAALIDSIEAGGGGSGGLPSPFTNITTGTFTLESLSYANAYTITHGLGKVPKLFAVYHDESGRFSGGSLDYVLYMDNSNTYFSDPGVGCIAICKSASAAVIKRSEVTISENTFNYDNSRNYFGSGVTYRWVAIA